jgi:predicted unusual protein kinase regulating ubiquinone biosynthesis (AarF/ABC1/UbiB family)
MLGIWYTIHPQQRFCAANFVHITEHLHSPYREHGGLYTKLGQYISTLNYALPKEYTETLAAVQDRAKTRPFDVSGILCDIYACD